VTDHFADRLLAAVERTGSPVCVGLDPVVDRLPDDLRRAGDGEAGRAAEFCRRVIEAVAASVPAVKLQSACFERYGPAGVEAYRRTVAAARDAGLIVIGDVKRGDIGPSAAHYAAGHLAPGGAPDAITVNAYFGADGTRPFIDAAADAGKGVFVLVRTSNPSAGSIQDFADAGGKRFHEHIAGQVAAWGGAPGLLGASGYSCVGAVVGATYPAEARRLREIMPAQVFLVPGYGAQGATAADAVAAADADGRGILINASRSVIYAHERPEYAGMAWLDAVAAAARAFADDVRSALGGGG